MISEEPDTGKLYYQMQESLYIPIVEKANVDEWQKDYDELVDNGWNVRQEGMLKVLLYPAENEFDILFMAHHLLCDGRGLLQLTEEFAQHYVNGAVPPFVKECLITTLEELPEKSTLPLISRFIIDDANKRWDKEQHSVSYEEYLDFERKYIKQNPVRRKIETLDGKELEAMQLTCRQQGISVNDFLIAKMMMEEQTDQVVIAADIRNRIRCYKHGALGNYSTAFGISVRKRGTNVLSLAKQVALQVVSIRKHPRKEMLVLACYLRMRPELIDAVAISTLGVFRSVPGAFVGKKMFGYGSQNGHCLTNLGKVQSDVIANAFFIPQPPPQTKRHGEF